MRLRVAERAAEIETRTRGELGDGRPYVDRLGPDRVGGPVRLRLDGGGAGRRAPCPGRSGLAARSTKAPAVR